MTHEPRGGLFAGVVERVETARIERRGYLAAALALLAIVVAYRGVHQPTHEHAAIAVALLLVARAVALGRALRVSLLGWSAVVLLVALAASTADHATIAWAAIAATGAVAGLPHRPPASAGADDRRHVWALVDNTSGDALAPFALRTDKSYVFSADRRAAVGYRVLLGTAIASGDPVGDPHAYPDAVRAFTMHAESHGWRIAILGASDRSLPLWREHGLRAIPIGRDVTVDVGDFALTGRRFRNLRQAVQRTRNSGVTTEIVGERELDDGTRDELTAVMEATGKGATRGFAMILDQPLAGTHPGTYVAVARSRTGKVVAFQRYATADGGRELSLDVPWRRPDAPNGVDERLIVDVIEWGAARGARSLSLAFAAFPELFELQRRNLLQSATHRAVHLLDRFIKLESLYRFVRKFHALGTQRYVVLRPLEVIWVAVAALKLEFSTDRRRRTWFSRRR